MKNKPGPKPENVSLHPLSFEEALDRLLKAKPEKPDKPKRRKAKRPRK